MQALYLTSNQSLFAIAFYHYCLSQSSCAKEAFSLFCLHPHLIIYVQSLTLVACINCSNLVAFFNTSQISIISYFN